MTLSSVSVEDSSGAAVAITVALMADGSKAPVHVLVDSSGGPIGPNNPLRMAPGIVAADFTDRSGQIATAGQTALDIQANPTRKGGSISAPIENNGIILVTLVKADGVTTKSFKLRPGASFSLVINPGYVLTQEVRVSGDTVGDLFDGVEFT